MIFFYIGCFIFSFMLLLFVIVSGMQQNIHQSLLVAMVVVANGGYLALALAQSHLEAILATKMIYVGGAFLQCFSFW